MAEILGLLSSLPWQVGIALALITYWLAHHLAVAPATVPAAQPGAIVIAAAVRSIARLLQYPVPLLCLIGALVSAIKSSKRKRLVDSVTASATVSALDGMSWKEFEVLVGAAFRMRGYTVDEVGGGGADEGCGRPDASEARTRTTSGRQDLSRVRRQDGRANSKIWRKRWRTVLGLFQVPNMSHHCPLGDLAEYHVSEARAVPSPGHDMTCPVAAACNDWP